MMVNETKCILRLVSGQIELVYKDRKILRRGSITINWRTIVRRELRPHSPTVRDYFFRPFASSRRAPREFARTRANSACVRQCSPNFHQVFTIVCEKNGWHENWAKFTTKLIIISKICVISHRSINEITS